MKKSLGIVLIVVIAFVFAAHVYAGERGCGQQRNCGNYGRQCRPCPRPYRPYRPCPPRPCGPGYGYGCGYRYNCSRDLGNAAAICDIVASGLSMAASVCQPAVVAAPVTPVVQPTVAAPAVATPVVATVPAAQPVVAPAAVAPVVEAPYGLSGRVVYYGR